MTATAKEANDAALTADQVEMAVAILRTASGDQINGMRNSSRISPSELKSTNVLSWARTKTAKAFAAPMK